MEKEEEKGSGGEEPPAAPLSSSLCDDLMIEILYRLPHKALCRFKAVSKGWYNVISGDEFLRTYYYFQVKKHSMTNSSTNGIVRKEATSSTLRNAGRPPVFSGLCAQGHRGVYCSKFYSSESLSHREECEGIRSNPSLGFLFFRGEKGIIKPLQSSNGLLLCRKIVVLTDKNNTTRECHSLNVCNPLTKQHFKLPSNPNHSSLYGMIDLDFDPICSGFDFRVVRIAVTEKEKHTLQIDYYTSGTGSWREHKLIVPTPACNWTGSTNGRIGFLNNVVFWQSLDRSSLIMYRLDEEYWQEIKLPGTIASYNAKFWKNQDRIYFYKSGYDGIRMWVLLIKEDYKEFQWELRHSISNEVLIGNNLDVAGTTLHHGPNSRYDCYRFEAFDYDFDLGILFLLFFGTIVSYDLQSGKVEVVPDFKFKKWTRTNDGLLPYQHSWALFHTAPQHL